MSKHHGSLNIEQREWKESIHPKRKQPHRPTCTILKKFSLLLNFNFFFRILINPDRKYFQNITCKNCHIISLLWFYVAISLFRSVLPMSEAYLNAILKTVVLGLRNSMSQSSVRVNWPGSKQLQTRPIYTACNELIKYSCGHIAGHHELIHA